jgi:hypothetical protein
MHLVRSGCGEGFAVDASLIQADANKQRSIADQEWRWDRDPVRSSRAVQEYLATLDDTAWGAAHAVSCLDQQLAGNPLSARRPPHWLCLHRVMGEMLRDDAQMP